MKTWFDWMEQYHLPCPQADGAQDGESERILTLTRSKLGLQETTPKGSAAAARPTVRRTRRLWVLAAAAALVLIGIITFVHQRKVKKRLEKLNEQEKERNQT